MLSMRHQSPTRPTQSRRARKFAFFKEVITASRTHYFNGCPPGRLFWNIYLLQCCPACQRSWCIVLILGWTRCCLHEIANQCSCYGPILLPQGARMNQRSNQLLIGARSDRKQHFRINSRRNERVGPGGARENALRLEEPHARSRPAPLLAMFRLCCTVSSNN